ncbi:methionyl-tRNA formyltransferase [Aquimarina sp. MAR_2010_214]|uniref:methionyl-tRNA formyltransferase n=1 Tax=Aquimarina sp. MAR_2010_214 TaxID=1250026 RepID=UPI001303FB1C|nr:formyltransferase family protein [Aquimarina sp. MAR_2010_214]
MKIILIGSFPTSISLYQYLHQNNHLQAVCMQEKTIQQSNQDSLSLIKQQEIETFVINNKNISSQFKDWLLDKSPDLVLVCSFSLKIPKEVLHIPKHGFLNIHFGKLPENRGPDPLFWSIKNGEKNTAITIYQMDEEWDTGKILIEQVVPIIPGETSGMVNSKMSFMLEQLAEKALHLIQNPENYKTQSIESQCIYNKHPNPEELTINWEEQTADEIENLVNACNPKYGGATTYYQGSPVQIIEVSPSDCPDTLTDKTPGEIVHIHPQEGLFVYCKDKKLLRVNIIHSDAGVLTGQKYFHLGVKQNQHFTTSIKAEPLIAT